MPLKDIEIDDSQGTATVVVDSPDVIQILQNSAVSLDSVTDLLDVGLYAFNVFDHRLISAS